MKQSRTTYYSGNVNRFCIGQVDTYMLVGAVGWAGTASLVAGPSGLSTVAMN